MCAFAIAWGNDNRLSISTGRNSNVRGGRKGIGESMEASEGIYGSDEWHSTVTAYLWFRFVPEAAPNVRWLSSLIIQASFRF